MVCGKGDKVFKIEATFCIFEPKVKIKKNKTKQNFPAIFINQKKKSGLSFLLLLLLLLLLYRFVDLLCIVEIERKR